MRRFWWLVMGTTLVAAGLIAGVALTYLSVILPRSAELQRIQNSSRFMSSLNLRALVARANASLQWTIEETKHEAPYQAGLEGPRIWGRMCTLSANVPLAEQKVQVDLIKGALMGAVNLAQPNVGIQSISGSSSQESDAFTQSDAFTYAAEGRNGTITLHAWGNGDKLRVFVIVQEQ